MILPEWFIKITEWMGKHPYKTMFFITIPLCVITSVLTTLLVM